VGILLLSFGLYLEGGLADQNVWKLKVSEVQTKVAENEVKAQTANTEIVTQLTTKTKVVHDRGQDIIKYIDREVAVDKEVVKFVETCAIPNIIIQAHNAAALNKPIEITKPPETAPTAPTKVEAPVVQPTVPKEKIISATAKKWSNLRESTDHSSKKIDKLSPGEVVVVVKQDGKFTLVKHNNNQGWISNDYISIVGDKS